MATELVTNGDFASGLTGWTTAGGGGYWTGAGGKAVGDGGIEGGPDTLTQTISGMSVGVEHTVSFVISGYSEYGPIADGITATLDEDVLEADIAADGTYSYAYTPTATTGDLEFSLTFGTYLELDDVSIINPGGATDVEYDISDDGWWRTHVRTRELVTAFTSDFLRVGADAYQAGAADAAAWAVGKTPTEITNELNTQTTTIGAYDTRDAFDFGRHIGLVLASGGSVPPFDATALNAVSGGLLYGWYASFVDRFALTPATSLKFLTEYDAFTRVFNRAYRAGWEGGAAAIYDDAQANAEGTSKVYDTSLIVSPFDTVQYDQYVTAYDFAYGAVWALLNP